MTPPAPLSLLPQAPPSKPAPRVVRSIAAEPSRRVFGLDVLRAAAIAGVVLSHGFAVLYPHVPHLGLLGHGGFYGVELFFVLSGFLIGQILLKTGAALGDPGSLGAFYTRRWFRTLPLFWLFLTVNVALEFFLHERRLAFSEIASHGLFLRTLTDNRVTFFAESWSLAIEEWFYLLFPTLLWFGLRLRRDFDRVFLLATAAFYLLSTLGRVVFALQSDAAWHTAPRMVVLFRFDALMIGVAAAWLAARFPTAWRRAARPGVVLGGVLLIAMYVTLWSYHRGYFVASPESFFGRTFRFNFVSLGFALLLPAASRWTNCRENAGTRAVRRIALWSYAMYLVHLPVFQLGQRWGFENAPTSPAQAMALFGLQMATTVLISALLFRFFESPCTRLRDAAAPRVMRWFRSAARERA